MDTVQLYANSGVNCLVKISIKIFLTRFMKTPPIEGGVVKFYTKSFNVKYNPFIKYYDYPFLFYYIIKYGAVKFFCKDRISDMRTNPPEAPPDLLSCPCKISAVQLLPVKKGLTQCIPPGILHLLHQTMVRII